MIGYIEPLDSVQYSFFSTHSQYIIFIKYSETEMGEDVANIFESITDSITGGHKKELEDFKFITFLNTIGLNYII